MVIVSDASPIIALDNIGELELLRLVFNEISITDIVAKEVNIELPKWILIKNDYEVEEFNKIKHDLDPGEASSIALCLSKPRSTLIIDERKGRKIAKERGVNIIGLIGVIVKAKKENLIDKGMPIIEKLRENGFRISDKILDVAKVKLNE